MQLTSLLPKRIWLAVAGSAIVLIAGVLALADAPALAAAESPLHPVFPLLDVDGQNVIESGEPVSTTQTCGACHDVEFIAAHDTHAGVLAADLRLPSGEAAIRDPRTGRLVALPPEASAAETNCFLCHVEGASNDFRVRALIDGETEWANTATLVDTGIVRRVPDGYYWVPQAFDEEGNLLSEYVLVGDPTVEVCGACHALASGDAQTPLTGEACSLDQTSTIATGQVFAPERIADSGLNIADKEEQTRAWDIHAERLLNCTDCHYALNNPAYSTETDETAPEHLIFDPRRLEPGEFLYQPLHELARTESDTTGADCTSCHDTASTHNWLPYPDRHMAELACETCHVPQMEMPAAQAADWTVLDASGGPALSCRGFEQDGDSGTALISGDVPALIPQASTDGATRITPANLVTTSYWVYGDPAQPVGLSDLQAAYFEGDTYAPEVLGAFDSDGNGTLDETELVIDSEAKLTVIAGRLAALGLDNPRIEARVEAYPIHHGIVGADWATQDCRACHGEESRLAEPVALAASTPGGTTPTLADGPLASSGGIVSGPGGALFYQTATGSEGDGTYVFGYSNVAIVDWIGIGVFFGTMLAVFAHGGLRVLAARRGASHAHEARPAYMYGVYERLWHWLQTTAILLLIFTGLIIHKPDIFAVFSFRGVAAAHNILAVILIVNAALSAFYHFASGQIRQFLPRPYGFFDQAIVQAKFYLSGIFKGEKHPFAKTPDHKLNPLQQIVYLGLLNVLLPLQIISGAFMWGVQRWPEVAAGLGGLPLLAPAHTLIAWLLASFVLGHVYLTTTGPTPLASIKGMIMGWDEVEAPSGAD